MVIPCPRVHGVGRAVQNHRVSTVSSSPIGYPLLLAVTRCAFLVPPARTTNVNRGSVEPRSESERKRTRERERVRDGGRGERKTKGSVKFTEHLVLFHSPGESSLLFPARYQRGADGGWEGKGRGVSPPPPSFLASFESSGKRNSRLRISGSSSLVYDRGE